MYIWGSTTRTALATTAPRVACELAGNVLRKICANFGIHTNHTRTVGNYPVKMTADRIMVHGMAMHVHNLSTVQTVHCSGCLMSHGMTHCCACEDRMMLEFLLRRGQTTESTSRHHHPFSIASLRQHGLPSVRKEHFHPLLPDVQTTKQQARVDSR